MAEKRSNNRETTKKTSVSNLLSSSQESGVASELVTAPLLPSPDDLAKYEKVVPGGAARLLDLTEQGIIHERDLRRKSLESVNRLKVFGAVTKFILGLVAGVLGGVLLINGSELAGLIIILVDAAALVATTLYCPKMGSS